jgi:capsular polysaccharide biosynthesis protein
MKPAVTTWPESSASGRWGRRKRPRMRLTRRLPPALRPMVRAAKFWMTRGLSATARRCAPLLPGSSRRFGPPRRFAPSLKAYAEEHPEIASYRQLYPAHVISRRLPLTSGRIRIEFLRVQESVSPAAGVAVIARGRVLTADGSVIAPPDDFIADVSDAWTVADRVAYKTFLARRLPPVTATDETVAVLTSHCGWFNYGHWINDTVPRLHLLENSGVAYDRIVIPDEFGFHRDMTALLGIDRAKMITARDLHLEARRLVVPNFPGIYGAPPAWACRYVRETFVKPAAAAARRRLLVSRNKPGAARQILNEDALLAALRPLGFERVFPEDFAFPDEVNLFRDAEIVIGALGAGMSNCIWCRPGAAMIELFSPCYVEVTNWLIANQVGLRYAYALGLGPARPLAGDDRGIYDDIVVDIDEVVQLIAALDLEPPA